jgi:lactoylglutathione lyase
MRYLHTMVRVKDLPAALRFFCDGLGLREVRRRDSEQGRFTLVFLGETADGDSPQLELTHNWDQTEAYPGGRNFGHVAYEVEDVYAACQRLIDHGYTISRPPRDGRMAFVRSPDLISVELLQKGEALPLREPWTTMPNVGEW